MRWRLPILLLLLASSGCAGPCPWLRLPQGRCYSRSLDDALACKVAGDVARQHLADRCQRQEWPSRDYQAGYVQAFQDIALGADGRTPLVPPETYWQSCARTPEGHQRARDWFAGYTDGAQVAWDCRGEFNRVYTEEVGGRCP